MNTKIKLLLVGFTTFIISLLLTQNAQAVGVMHDSTTITGIVTPVEWDEDENVIAVAISVTIARTDSNTGTHAGLADGTTSTSPGWIRLASEGEMRMRAYPVYSPGLAPSPLNNTESWLLAVVIGSTGRRTPLTSSSNTKGDSVMISLCHSRRRLSTCRWP